MVIEDFSYGLITLSTRDISEITISRVKELIPGPTREHTLENGEITRCMVRVSSTGRIAVRYTEENIEMIKSMDMEKFVG